MTNLNNDYFLLTKCSSCLVFRYSKILVWLLRVHNQTILHLFLDNILHIVCEKFAIAICIADIITQGQIKNGQMWRLMLILLFVSHKLLEP
jgi:hypothetical protein